MISQWALISNRINAMNKRERLLVFACVLTVIYLFWDLVFFQPLTKKRLALSDQLAQAEQQMKTVLDKEAMFSKLLAKDPDANKKRELSNLKKRLAELDAELEKLSVGLIAADKLPEVLYDVLSSKGRLKLVSMKTLPVQKLRLLTEEELDEQSDEEKEDELGQGVVGVYRHSVSVVLNGKYFDVIDYLKSLESLEWKFYWELLEYNVDSYPKANVTLEVYTLSTEEGVISA